MVLNIVINYYLLKGLVYQDKYKKEQPKLQHKNAKSGRLTNTAKFV